jgi:hypothetical protein
MSFLALVRLCGGKSEWCSYDGRSDPGGWGAVRVTL